MSTLRLRLSTYRRSSCSSSLHVRSKATSNGVRMLHHSASAVSSSCPKSARAEGSSRSDSWAPRGRSSRARSSSATSSGAPQRSRSAAFTRRAVRAYCTDDRVGRCGLPEEAAREDPRSELTEDLSGRMTGGDPRHHTRRRGFRASQFTRSGASTSTSPLNLRDERFWRATRLCAEAGWPPRKRSSWSGSSPLDRHLRP
jgi:hypothetical protein